MEHVPGPTIPAVHHKSQPILSRHCPMAFHIDSWLDKADTCIEQTYIALQSSYLQSVLYNTQENNHTSKHISNDKCHSLITIGIFKDSHSLGKVIVRFLCYVF